MLEIGMKNNCTVKVTDANTAKTMGSGSLDVFATPSMIALMENEFVTKNNSKKNCGYNRADNYHFLFIHFNNLCFFIFSVFYNTLIPFVKSI